VRVDAQHELEGLDASECGVEAYGEELKGFSAEALIPESAAMAVAGTEKVQASS